MLQKNENLFITFVKDLSTQACENYSQAWEDRDEDQYYSVHGARERQTGSWVLNVC